MASVLVSPLLLLFVKYPSQEQLRGGEGLFGLQFQTTVYYWWVQAELRAESHTAPTTKNKEREKAQILTCLLFLSATLSYTIQDPQNREWCYPVFLA